MSRKVGNAVTRNRVRRRLREALRAYLRERASVEPAPSYDLLVITRPSAAEVDYHDLASALRRSIERALSAPSGAPRAPRPERTVGSAA